MKKIFSVFVIITVLLCSVFVPAAAYTPTSFEITAESAIMASLDTGDVVFTKNADTKRYPASITKIMTALLVLENTENLDTEIITVTEFDVKSLYGTDSSVGGLQPGEQLTARQMLYYLLMMSANDGALAIAEHYGGTVEKFVEMMNQRATELGMNNTHYVNPHGLYDSDHYTTAYDVYLLTKAALQHEVFKEIVSTTRYNMPPTNLSGEKLLLTTNMLIDPSTAYYYKYATGGKTGYHDEAGRCLMSTAEKDGYSYIVVLMKCPVTDSEGNRVRYEFTDTKNLYEWMFNEFEYKTVFDTTSIMGEAPVDLSFESDYVSLVPKTGLSAILPKEADISTVKIDIKLFSETIEAPVNKGDELGTAEISYAGETLGTLQLVAGDSVEGSLILKIWHYITLAVKSTAFKIIMAAIGVILLALIVYIIIINRKRKRRKRRRY